MDRKPFRFGTNNSARTGDEIAANARALESWGYDAMYAGDHLPGRWMEPFGPLTWAAAATTKLRLATLVLANDFRNPVMLAKQAATLDRLCGGRFELGLGAGWWDRDYAMLGIPFDPPGKRLARMEEGIAVMRRYWAGERFSYDGVFYTVRDVDPGPAPVQPGGPPLMIGGGGPKILRIAGREADIIGPVPKVAGGAISKEFFTEMTREAVAGKIRRVKDSAEKAGRDPSKLVFQSMVNYLAVTGSEQEAAELRAGITNTIGLPDEQVREAPTILVGTASQLQERIWRDREELGFSDWVLIGGEVRGFGSITMDTFERLGAEVLRPLLARG